MQELDFWEGIDLNGLEELRCRLRGLVPFLDQRSLSWSAPKTGSSMGVPVRAALRSLRVCSSSSRLMKSR